MSFERPKRWAMTRRRIYARDEGVCHLCGYVISDERWDVDHVVPRSLGGGHEDTNLALAHKVCNSSKQARVDSVVVERVRTHLPFSRQSRFS